MTWKLFVLVIVAPLVWAGCSKKSSSQAVEPTKIMKAEEADLDCDSFRKSLPVDWQQGFVTVPEDPSHPEGQQIQVFYYGKWNADAVLTIYFNGGPGASSHSDYRVLTQKQRIFDPGNEISMLFIDQRGNGCSQPYPQGHDVATLRRLALYGSRQIVEDSEVVRKLVWGNKPWIVAGQSYGGYVVHRYVVLHPESVVAAIAQEEVLTSDGYFRLKTRIASQARVLDDYLTEYPDDKDRLTRLHNYLTLSQCYTSPKSSAKSCGLAVLSQLSLVTTG